MVNTGEGGMSSPLCVGCIFSILGGVESCFVFHF